MTRKCHVRFGGGTVEKCLSRQLATFLPYYVVWQGAPSKLCSLKSVAIRIIGYLKPIRK